MLAVKEESLYLVDCFRRVHMIPAFVQYHVHSGSRGQQETGTCRRTGAECRVAGDDRRRSSCTLIQE
jgi:hypothetical protein